ncbi:MAG: aspartate--tRNA ligase [Candidatus Micrarchaeota archaeon]|nr:aspartate--tRNA ligase [Candidatus Micrarchaeota archaeon]MDE1848266.1 aspartate--tRNA ligase [Candidatus Micrarchaeota archaeon]MDE1864742.1 aspartate--tRNA ligase [Candidatus Micrarchaeota archaeon]
MEVNCGELTEKQIGSTVILHGWCRYIRDHGGKLFIDLSDKHGATQLVFEGKLLGEASRLGKEYVIEVSGKVSKRSEETVDSKSPTGRVEVAVTHMKLLNHSKIPPFELIEEKEKFLANEELRLKYRYLDLRRPAALRNVVMKDKITKFVREYFWKNDFLELETPIMVKDTYETGARTFLVPSRVNTRKFYSLPQSPQFYKQICMIAGLERYFQIAKCFRDEDPREDRQTEFTQIDIEVAFKDEQYIESLIEGMFKKIFKEVVGKSLKTPFRHMSFEEAMQNYGSDKPDLRYENKIVDITEEAVKSNYNILKRVAENGGRVKAVAFSGAKYGAKDGQINENYMLKSIELAKSFGLRGLTWLYVKGGKISSEPQSIADSLAPSEKQLLKKLSPKDGDVIIIGSDTSEKILLEVIGKLRKVISDKIRIYDSEYTFLWVDEMPLFEMDEVTRKFKPLHNPVTSPTPETLKFLESEPEKVMSRQYDLVLNGVELGSGSIRIIDPELQRKVLKIIGMGEKTIDNSFGFLIEALSYGAPPEGGVALGLDRIVAMLCGENNIRDFILFPKNKRGELLLDGSPSEIDPKRLKEDYDIIFPSQ